MRMQWVAWPSGPWSIHGLAGSVVHVARRVGRSSDETGMSCSIATALWVVRISCNSLPRRLARLDAQGRIETLDCIRKPCLKRVRLIRSRIVHSVMLGPRGYPHGIVRTSAARIRVSNVQILLKGARLRKCAGSGFTRKGRVNPTEQDAQASRKAPSTIVTACPAIQVSSFV